MKTDKELADAIVDCRVGMSATEPDGTTSYSIDCGSCWLTPEVFVRSWEISGALMEKVNRGFEIGTFKYNDGRWTARIRRSDWCGLHESLPRAICEAAVAALEGNDGQT